MSVANSISVAEDWQKAVNEQNVEGLLHLSDENIEMAGPKGSAFGHKILVEWLGKAGLILKTKNRFAKNNVVLLEQDGVWKDDHGNVTGEASVSTVMKVENGKVTYLSRYDNDLEKALSDADLNEKDKR